jgi:phosphate uptake regulator
MRLRLPRSEPALRPAIQEKAMFRELLTALRARDPLAELLDDFDRMLADGSWMFSQALLAIDREKSAKELADDIYARDQAINAAERQVRAGVLSRLAPGDGTLLPPCLVLMSVVKDAERIGDHCKNLLEVGQYYEGPWDVPQFADPLKKVRHQLLPMFEKTRKAFREGDRHLAREVIDSAVAIAQKCELLLQQLLVGVKMSSGQSVAYALMSRYLKRIALYLANISTAVVAPVHKLDYADESKGSEEA